MPVTARSSCEGCTLHGSVNWQMLSAVKGGRGGIRFINESFHHDRCRDGPHAFAVGEPVIYLAALRANYVARRTHGLSNLR
jgi:hypothetical protein